MKLCVLQGSIYLLLATATCRLLVLPPPKFVLDRLTSAVEEEQSTMKILMCSCLTDKNVHLLTFYYLGASEGLLIWWGLGGNWQLVISVCI